MTNEEIPNDEGMAKAECRRGEVGASVVTHFSAFPTLRLLDLLTRDNQLPASQMTERSTSCRSEELTMMPALPFGRRHTQTTWLRPLGRDTAMTYPVPRSGRANSFRRCWRFAQFGPNLRSWVEPITY